MIANIQHADSVFKIDLSKPLDIAMPLRAGEHNANAWYRPPVRIEPVRMGDWVGDVDQGSSVNFRDIWFNPHAHGTHTETLWHISNNRISIHIALEKFFFLAKVITVTPELIDDDHVIMPEQLHINWKAGGYEAIIIRTLPNDESKLKRQYSNINPPYLHVSAAELLRKQNVSHLLIDLPSVDKEKDEGKLLAHRAFWNYPAQPRLNATITELIYLPREVADGDYILNLQVASFENDAAPSRPVLYRML